MFEIKSFACEGMTGDTVTDSPAPVFTYYVASDRPGASVRWARLTVNGWTAENPEQRGERYAGPGLKPFTRYDAVLTAEDDQGQTARAALTFETGRLNTPWQGRWISDGGYIFKEKKVSPIPMVFRRKLTLKGEVASARLYATAIGIYELMLNGKKVGDRYFAPGFTSYASQLQYQTYDVTEALAAENELTAVVAGGWAVGSFVFTRVNRVTAKRQAFLAELHITYWDGTREVIGTDDSWSVTEDGPVRMADLYDGETYDATVDLEKASWRKAVYERLPVKPRLLADYGAGVTAHEAFPPLSCREVGGALVYDFGQNFAGVVRLTLTGQKGQKITVRHAEVLNPDGTLNTTFLRTAKATATYICKEGVQTWSPRLTYMGFRYISVEGANRESLRVTGVALYSQLERTGSFRCSNALLNRLQENIVWGAKSNFVDIPTDCPQRDERMGWTGDIAVFSPTACYNFDMRRFLSKWLLDVRSEQLPTGGIPNTVPVQGYGFPATMPKMAVAWWGDACVLVPWAEYMARGDTELLREMYPAMKKYVNACRFWCSFGFGKHRYLWEMPGVLGFGDWVAPDVPKMSQWQSRVKWTGTASLCNTSALLSRIAGILGKWEDERRYRELSEKTADAYCSLLTDGKGKLLQEFQTAYVLPIYLNMFPDQKTRLRAAENLAALAEKNDWCIGTGFPGTPYLLFALCDNGQREAAYKMLLNTRCPSWLYEVKAGATTVWERWDGLDENGVCPIGDDGTDMMISYNHYASGAVGDFLYRRVAGIEPVEAGYKTFRVEPVPGGDLTWASAQVRTPYGDAGVAWKTEEDVFTVTVTVPVGASCRLVLPDGREAELNSGVHTESCEIRKKEGNS